MRAFLIGGGRDPGRARAAHEPFVAAAGRGGPITALVLDEGEATDVDRWATTLAAAGAGDVRVRVVEPGRPPTSARQPPTSARRGAIAQPAEKPP
ncbi:MAG TPA: hypothetical protein VLB47_02560 [Solirubrobacteraceae bacterium]|nr:hypothetical protein [Solirubrobacteraceae bacterium]